MATSHETGDGPALELKGRMGTVSVLRLLDPNADAVLSTLDGHMATAPAMFAGMPVIIDGGGLDAWPADEALMSLVSGLRERGLVPVALAGEGADGLAQRIGLGLMPDSADRASSQGTAKVSEPANAEEPAVAAARVVEQPIRSGQQIYGRGGDLVVIASVSPGAEVMADGHIHIYGALNGRAMAGVQGDTNASIFCRRFNAELVAVAGHYQVSDHFREADRGREVRVRLRDQTLVIESMPGIG